MMSRPFLPVVAVSIFAVCSLAAKAGDGTGDMRKQFEEVLGRDFKGWYFATLPFTGAEIGKVRIDERNTGLTSKTPLVNLGSWLPETMTEPEKLAVLGRVIEEKDGGELDLTTDQARKSGGAFGVAGLFRVLGLSFSTSTSKNVKVSIKTGNVKVRQILWEEFAQRFNSHVFAPALNSALKQQDIIMCFGDISVDGYRATVSVDRSSNTQLAARLDFLAGHTAANGGKPGGKSGGTGADISIGADSGTGKTSISATSGGKAISGSVTITDGGKSGTKATGSAHVGTGAGSSGAGTGTRSTDPGTGTPPATGGTSTGAGGAAGDTESATSVGAGHSGKPGGSGSGKPGGSGQAPGGSGSGAPGGSGSGKPGGSGSPSGGGGAPAGAPADDVSVSAANSSQGTWVVSVPKEVVIAYLYKNLPKEPLSRGAMQIRLNGSGDPKPQVLGMAFEKVVRTTSGPTRLQDIRLLQKAKKHLRKMK